ncbi:hypothetical protein BV22DRAFT_1051424 [Leucogyrophana mollusca]|uniref:Uncharacterized protein n=1 Tax=Leucogyrophana mollusca TaxID=85980 RepID=A0ACB8B1C5_9AGAM|nr:hypothetical protein BV22DRAFT_1051424 [Leucogyrophana mollusca]
MMEICLPLKEPAYHLSSKKNSIPVGNMKTRSRQVFLSGLAIRTPYAADLEIPLHPHSRLSPFNLATAALSLVHGTQLTSATFEGQGTRVHMKNVFNNREHWSFVPFDFTATVCVPISSNNGGRSWNISKMVGPLAIEKKPEPDYPTEFLVATDRADYTAELSIQTRRVLDQKRSEFRIRNVGERERFGTAGVQQY